MKKRCEWANDQPLNMEYHDQEWGVPVHDDKILFEFLILEGAQAGLSWITILKKRENYREAFDDFDYHKIAQYDQDKIEALVRNEGIIRHRGKIEATIQNAKMFIEIQKEYGSFDQYIWQFVDGKPKKNSWPKLSDVPVSTNESQEMSKALKKKGFKFVGPTICYAFMQAVGMVNDHTVDCFRYEEM